MRRVDESFVVVLLTCVGSWGCGGSQGAPKAPSQSEPTPAPVAELTAEACEASGGTVVGDIGDGATHRPDYRCPSGAKPSGNIRAPEGGPIGVEGSICCPK